MSECTYPRCQQERRTIRRELQRWSKNMVYVLGLERVAEELMGRRKWKLYQDALLPRPRSAPDTGESSEEDVMPAAEQEQLQPALKIKTIEQINTVREEDNNTIHQEEGTKRSEPERTETILESLIKRPAAQPRISEDWRPACPSHRRPHHKEPADWQPADRCYFCDNEGGAAAAQANAGRIEGGATSPAASESDSSSVSGGARSPAAAPAAPPALLAHLLQLQNHNPQAIAQFQQMMAALAALGSGLMPQAALSQAWILQQLQQNQILQQQQHHVDRLTADMGEKVSVSNCSPSFSSGGGTAEQPLDLSARSGSSTGEPATPPPSDLKLASRVPPIDPKFLANVRMKRPAVDGGCGGSMAGMTGMAAATRRAYTEDELQSALRDIQSGRLGTRRAAVLYGIPRSTLRNKVYKLAMEHPGAAAAAERDSGDDDEPDALYRSLLLQAADRDPPRDIEDDAPGVILKIPTFRPERDDSPPPGAPVRGLSDVPYSPLAFASPHAPHAQHGPPTGETLFSLRDVIAKSISQKFQQAPERLEQELGFHRPPPDRHISVIKQMPDTPRPAPYHTNSIARGIAGNNGAPPSQQQATGGKGTRPKRGKYRNYDRDSLVEAVKAVQRGEMSVHRAGSYYGVPHSTLEYKVKERHLMRPRKRELKQPPPDVKPPAPPKPPPPKPHGKPGFPNGMNGPDSLSGTGAFPPAGYPFWNPSAAFPLATGGSFAPGGDSFASHMMQRLREESAPPPANGSFLEGIIRSSLERPGALLQRLTGEPPPQHTNSQRVNDVGTFNSKANVNLLQRLTGEGVSPAPGGSLLQRLTNDSGGGGGGSDEGSPPPARRPRLSSSDRQLAEEMRETVQRLRADKLRAAGRNGTPTPPASLPLPPASAAAPVDRA